MAANFNDTIIEEFRANDGKVAGMFAQMNLLLITTKGAKSGTNRVSPVAFTKDGDNYIIIASYGGGPNNPAWYHNLVTNPEVTVEVGGEKFQAKASVAPKGERERLYEAHATVYPTFNDYKKKTDRVIPVVVLTKV